MPYIGKSPSFGVRQRYQYTATASQTTFSGTDTANLTLSYTDNNFVDVYQNGVLLKGGGNDYTATSGTSVVLGTGATADDVIEIIVYDAFSAANFYSRTDSDSRYQATLAGIDDQSSSNDDQITITDSTVVINEDSDDVDFRVESNGNTAALFVDGGNDQVICGANAPVGRFSANLEVTAHGGSHRGGIMVNNFQAGATDSVLEFNKSRNDTFNSHTIVQSGDNLGSIIFRGSDGGEFVDAAAIACLSDTTPGDDDMPGRLSFFTTSDGASGGTERLRIDRRGIILVPGTNSDTSGSERIVVSVTSGGSPGNGISFIRTGTSGTISAIACRTSGGSFVGGVQFTNSSTSFPTSSDYRLKENIVTEWDATTRLKQLKPSRFNFKEEPDKTVDGFLAHEVSDIVPEAIYGEKDAVDKNGNIEPQAIDHSKLVPLLTKALQESIARADALEARIKKLEDG